MTDELEYDQYAKQDRDAHDTEIDTNIDINPDYYIHRTLLSLNDVLVQDTDGNGFKKYRVLIQQIECYVMASKKMDKAKYEEQLKTWHNEYKQEDGSDRFERQQIALSQFKLKLFMEMFFDRKKRSSALEM